MLTLPDAIVAVLVPFATLFTSPTPGRGRGQAWRKAQVLLAGAILTPGQRTVAAALRVMGRSDHRAYARYHEVLNRAVWSSRAVARVLLALLLQHLDRGDGPLVFGIDETLERRRGAKIRARAIYRDPVRSSRSQLVKASGLRWISLMWLGQVPWAGRHWALPVLTVLAPSTRYYQQQGRQHKKLTDWARQMILQLRRRPRTPPDLAGRQAEDRSLGIGHHPRGADCQQVPHGVGAQVEDAPDPSWSPLDCLTWSLPLPSASSSTSPPRSAGAARRAGWRPGRCPPGPASRQPRRSPCVRPGPGCGGGGGRWPGLPPGPRRSGVSPAAAGGVGPGQSRQDLPDATVGYGVGEPCVPVYCPHRGTVQPEGGDAEPVCVRQLGQIGRHLLRRRRQGRHPRASDQAVNRRQAAA